MTSKSTETKHRRRKSVSITIDTAILALTDVLASADGPSSRGCGCTTGGNMLSVSPAMDAGAVRYNNL